MILIKIASGIDNAFFKCISESTQFELCADFVAFINSKKDLAAEILKDFKGIPDFHGRSDRLRVLKKLQKLAFRSSDGLEQHLINPKSVLNLEIPLQYMKVMFTMRCLKKVKES